MPLSQIREIALDKALLGEPVLSHKGVDYGIPAAEEQGSQTAATDLQTLLVYDEKKGVYVKKELKDISSYTVQELVRLPNSHEAADQYQPVAEKPARPQPKHLKMRFHPVGSGNLAAETIGSSSESEAENNDEPTFRVPRLEQKRKTDSNQDQGEKKKKKKEKHASSQEVVSTDQKRGRQDGESEKKASKHRNETSQERRARKEKKKRKAEKS